MRKIQCLCFTVIIVLCITVTGCKLDSADESAMLYEASEIATEPAEKYGLEFDTEVFLDGNLWHTIRNNSENDYECGGIEVLEILDNDTWCSVKRNEGAPIVTGSFVLRSKKELELGSMIRMSYSALSEGRYRVIGRFCSLDEKGRRIKGKEFYLPSEFDYMNPVSKESDSKDDIDILSNATEHSASQMPEIVEDSNVELKVDEYKEGNLKISFMDKDYSTGDNVSYRIKTDFLLEYQNDDMWYVLPKVSDKEYRVGTIGLGHRPIAYDVLLRWLYNDLSSGHYRLIGEIEKVEYSNNGEESVSSSFCVAAEFDI